MTCFLLAFLVYFLFKCIKLSNIQLNVYLLTFLYQKQHFYFLEHSHYPQTYFCSLLFNSTLVSSNLNKLNQNFSTTKSRKKVKISNNINSNQKYFFLLCFYHSVKQTYQSKRKKSMIISSFSSQTFVYCLSRVANQCMESLDVPTQ